MTVRCANGSSSIARRRDRASRVRAAAPPAASRQSVGKRPPAARDRARPAPRNRSGSTAGSPVVVLERGEGQRASLADGSIAGDVGDDLQDPRAQPGAALEALEALENPEPGVLDDLFCVAARADVAPGDREHRRIEGRRLPPRTHAPPDAEDAPPVTASSSAARSPAAGPITTLRGYRAPSARSTGAAIFAAACNESDAAGDAASMGGFSRGRT